jgi:hypothetical protein
MVELGATVGEVEAWLWLASLAVTPHLGTTLGSVLLCPCEQSPALTEAFAAIVGLVEPCG